MGAIAQTAFLQGLMQRATWPLVPSAAAFGAPGAMTHMPRIDRRTRLVALLAAATIAPLALWAGSPLGASGASQGALQQQIGAAKSREQALAGAAGRLGQVIAKLSASIAVVQKRLADVNAQLGASQQRLAQTRAQLGAQRRRALGLRFRLARDRTLLAEQLRAAYMSDRPDLMTVVLESRGFADLLDRVDFSKRISHQDHQVVSAVRTGRQDARHSARVLVTLAALRRRETAAIQRQRNAVAAMNAGLQQRRALLAQARAARLAALRNTRRGRIHAEHELSAIIAAQNRAASSAGPGGPWAIPWAIVQCESGGQNLPPNYATASGYYQMLDSTWHGLGGREQHAYQASKSEQDQRAAALWNHGAGASNWVCAVLLGIA